MTSLCPSDACRLHSAPNRFLNQARIQMVSTLLTGFVVSPPLMLGEHPLPDPFPLRIWVFSAECPGQFHSPVALGQVFHVQLSYPLQVMSQALAYTNGKLGGSADLELHSQVGQKGVHFFTAHLPGMAEVVEPQKPPQPLLVRVYGASRVVAGLQLLPVALDQGRRAGAPTLTPPPAATQTDSAPAAPRGRRR